jgi:hypothetical protein
LPLVPVQLPHPQARFRYLRKSSDVNPVLILYL